MSDPTVLDTDDARQTVLEVRDLVKHFPVRHGLLGRVSGHIYAVNGVSFAIREGETLALVGESGCGKSTVGKTVLRLLDPTGGRILLSGEDITHLSNRQLHSQRRDMQMVFQDPYSSLNPRMPCGEIVGESFAIYEIASGREKEQRISALFERVGLHAEQKNRYPHELSGGQRQRLGIARALALNPRLIIADEPVSALDVSVQAQVINLMRDLQREFKLAYLFVSHDLAVVEHISHRIAVMYLGNIVELAQKRTFFATPLHPYSEALLSAVPVPDPRSRRERIILRGDVPSPGNPPPGCTFHTRCPLAEDICRKEVPALREISPGHWAACHLR